MTDEMTMIYEICRSGRQKRTCNDAAAAAAAAAADDDDDEDDDDDDDDDVVLRPVIGDYLHSTLVM